MRALLVICIVSLAGAAMAGEVTIQSGPARTHLLELFTSEGCSSCPPAEHRLSALRDSPRLWKDLVPVAFHVDYWDRLGWKDMLASPLFTKRQREYAAAWGAAGVYTPGFVLDGAEWQGRDPSAIPTSKTPAGKLTATLRESGEGQIAFTPPAGAGSSWQAHAALLALGVTIDVKAGENSGRKLVHDFVVLAHETGAMTKNGDALQAGVRLPASKLKHGQTALAVWITESGGPTPRQAAGGPL